MVVILVQAHYNEEAMLWEIGPSADSDNDGVLDADDECPNTIGEQIVYGCSCEQILELKPGKNKSAKCSPGIIKVFTKRIGWAKDLF